MDKYKIMIIVFFILIITTAIILLLVFIPKKSKQSAFLVDGSKYIVTILKIGGNSQQLSSTFSANTVAPPPNNTFIITKDGSFAINPSVAGIDSGLLYSISLITDDGKYNYVFGAQFIAEAPVNNYTIFKKVLVAPNIGKNQKIPEVTLEK